MSSIPLSLYIHFPWCIAKCPYCDFNSHVHRGELPVDRYVDRLLEEFSMEAHKADGRDIQTIFMGGGTPSLFPPETIHRLLQGIATRWPVSAHVEVTLEANPGALEYGSFQGYKEAGVNRVSMGAQSFQAHQLKRLGRIHQAQDTKDAVSQLMTAGLNNFNIDLMNQLPDQQVALALDDLHQAIALQAKHISLYELTIEPNTVFAAFPPTLPDDELSEQVHVASLRLLSQSGYEQYEVSAFAKPGFQCRHNLNYWQFGDYLAIGAGAHGKWTNAHGQITRVDNAKLPRDYLNRSWDEIKRVEILGRERLPFEFMMNALRLRQGFEWSMFEQRTFLTRESLQSAFEVADHRGLVEIGPTQVRASPTGYRYLNELLAIFLDDTVASTHD